MQIWPWCRNALQAPGRAGDVEVGVVEHDQRVVAAELQARPASGSAGGLADQPADRGRAGERDHRDVRVLGQRRAGLGVAGQHVQQAARAARPPRTAGRSGRRRRPAVCTSGLRMTALPSASAGATARTDRICGKFHGLMTPTTPSGTPPGDRLAGPARWSAAGGPTAGWAAPPPPTARRGRARPRTRPCPVWRRPRGPASVSNSARLSSRTRAARRISAARCGPGLGRPLRLGRLGRRRGRGDVAGVGEPDRREHLAGGGLDATRARRRATRSSRC